MLEASGVSFALLRAGAKTSASPNDSTSTTPAAPGPGQLSSDNGYSAMMMKTPNLLWSFGHGSLMMQGQQVVHNKHGPKIAGWECIQCS